MLYHERDLTWSRLKSGLHNRAQDLSPTDFHREVANQLTVTPPEENAAAFAIFIAVQPEIAADGRKTFPKTRIAWELQANLLIDAELIARSRERKMPR